MKANSAMLRRQVIHVVCALLCCLLFAGNSRADDAAGIPIVDCHVHLWDIGRTEGSAWIAKDPLKRDRLDAFKLGDLLRMDQVHEVYYADDDQRTVFRLR